MEKMRQHMFEERRSTKLIANHPEGTSEKFDYTGRLGSSGRLPLQYWPVRNSIFNNKKSVHLSQKILNSYNLYWGHPNDIRNFQENLGMALIFTAFQQVVKVHCRLEMAGMI